MKTTQVASSSSGGVNNKKRKLNEVSQSKKENNPKTVNSKPTTVADQARERGKSVPKGTEPKKIKKSSSSKDKEEDSEVHIADNDDSAVKALKNGLFSLYGRFHFLVIFYRSGGKGTSATQGLDGQHHSK